eukprot:TRINITY_DN10415_c0_g2_i1.p1 TRINITY_DN10415_c0_g2~~TRINITY_DN10415_c0_g2_i1.p1  ORF type:complete len:261 (-),score=46.29 TRINITY_DN10415_c0_g2_i1:24-746(-)
MCIRDRITLKEIMEENQKKYLSFKHRSSKVLGFLKKASQFIYSKKFLSKTQESQASQGSLRNLDIPGFNVTQAPGWINPTTITSQRISPDVVSNSEEKTFESPPNIMFATVKSPKAAHTSQTKFFPSKPLGTISNKDRKKSLQLRPSNKFKKEVDSLFDQIQFAETDIRNEKKTMQTKIKDLTTKIEGSLKKFESPRAYDTLRLIPVFKTPENDFTKALMRRKVVNHQFLNIIARNEEKY